MNDSNQRDWQTYYEQIARFQMDIELMSAGIIIPQHQNVIVAMAIATYQGLKERNLLKSKDELLLESIERMKADPINGTKSLKELVKALGSQLDTLSPKVLSALPPEAFNE